MALILEKQGKSQEAEKQMFRGYVILSLSMGIASRDCQTFFDEMIDLVTRRKDLRQAETYSAKNYDNVKAFDKGKNSLELADCSARYAVIMAQQGKFEQALPLFEQTLSIREKMLGKSHVGTAHALLQLSNVYDKLG
jgi:tetratricopeptide (TPR) repeat protein